MPRLKERPEVTQDKQFCGKVAEKMILYGYDTKEDLAERLGINRKTLRYKLADPDKFNRKELRQLFRILKFSAEEKGMVM